MLYHAPSPAAKPPTFRWRCVFGIQGAKTWCLGRGREREEKVGEQKRREGGRGREMEWEGGRRTEEKGREREEERLVFSVIMFYFSVTWFLRFDSYHFSRITSSVMSCNFTPFSFRIIHFSLLRSRELTYKPISLRDSYVRGKKTQGSMNTRLRTRPGDVFIK